jgi:hypothetical protein
MASGGAILRVMEFASWPIGRWRICRVKRYAPSRAVIEALDKTAARRQYSHIAIDGPERPPLWRRNEQQIGRYVTARYRNGRISALVEVMQNLNEGGISDVSRF